MEDIALEFASRRQATSLKLTVEFNLRLLRTFELYWLTFKINSVFRVNKTTLKTAYQFIQNSVNFVSDKFLEYNYQGLGIATN